MGMEEIETVTSDAPIVDASQGVDQAAPVVVNEQQAKAPADAEAKDDTGGAGKPDETPPWLKAEVTKERNRRRAAEDEAKRLAEQLDNLTRSLADKADEQQAKPADARPARPKADDFFHPEDFERAQEAYDEQMVEWQIAQAERRVEERLSKKGQQEAQSRQIEDTQKAWQTQVDTAKKEYPDFEEVVYSDDFQCSPAMMQAIVADENGAKVAYHLATNPEEATRINALSPVRQIVEIGKLADKISKPAPVSKAPAPIKPLGNQAPAIAKAPAEESEAEYFARRTAEAKARKEKMY